VASVHDLERAVDHAFDRTARGLLRWPDPHPDRMPLDEEYSRVLDPSKWRIIPARAEAWCTAAVELGIATLQRDVAVRWVEGGGAHHHRIDRLVPRVEGGLPLVLAHAGLAGEVPGVTIAIGDPAVVVGLSPDCGCDACDAGSERELEHLDEQIRMVVSGSVRHLSAGDRTIVSTDRGISATGRFRRREIEKVLATPHGWHEVSGASWIAV
jgi:hypothetical protein